MGIRNAIAILAMSAMMSSPAWSACDGAAPPPDSRYTVEGGKVYDAMTNLTWQRCSYGLHWSDTTGCGGVIRGVTWDEAMSAPPEGWRCVLRRSCTSVTARRWMFAGRKRRV